MTEVVAVDSQFAIKRSVVVEVSRERAFAVFTEGIDTWWPREHHIGESPLDKEVLEPKEGGRWYGRSADGTEQDVGYVIRWDPPSSLLLGWQLTSEWTYDPNFMTEVEVTFTADGPKRTVVTLEHRNLDRYGEKADEIQSAVGSEGGWNGMLVEFARVAENV